MIFFDGEAAGDLDVVGDIVVARHAHVEAVGDDVVHDAAGNVLVDGLAARAPTFGERLVEVVFVEAAE